MGSIYCIFSDFNRWEKTNQTEVTKTNESVTKFVIGRSLNDFQAEYPIEIFIRDSIYEKLQNKEYIVDPQSNIERKLTIKDCNGNKIEPLLENYCY